MKILCKVVSVVTVVRCCKKQRSGLPVTCAFLPNRMCTQNLDAEHSFTNAIVLGPPFFLFFPNAKQEGLTPTLFQIA